MSNCFEKTLLYQIDENIRQRYKKRVLGDMDQLSIDTLKSFFYNDLNITKTAKYLYIHRNTLLYRLEKCKKETGLNPKKYSDAVKLQIAMWCWVNHVNGLREGDLAKYE